MNVRAWLKAALIRAARTAAQTAISLVGTGAVGFTDLDWVHIASVSGVAAVVSLLTSIAGLPEVESAQHDSEALVSGAGDGGGTCDE